MQRENQEKFIKNILLFTAPALAVFFGQLATGVDYKAAFFVALLAFWGLLADYMKKINEQ